MLWLYADDDLAPERRQEVLQAWVACEATVEFWGYCSSHTYAAGRPGVSLHQGCYAQRTGSLGAVDPAAWWRTSNFDEPIRKQNLPGAIGTDIARPW